MSRHARHARHRLPTRRHPFLRRAALAALGLLALFLGGCTLGAATADATPTNPTAESVTALAALNETGHAPTKGYDRDRFGGWKKTGRNCDMRDLILARDSASGTVRYTVGSLCNVGKGTWRSVYDDQTIRRVRDVDVDHIVPLANAWRSGAALWDDTQRAAFANDNDNLIAVSLTSNRAKGDQSPDAWKPPNVAAHCDYAKAWITVKTKYALTVTKPERAALAGMLDTCTGGRP